MAATATTRSATRVIDGDGHIIERDAELFEFLEPPYQGNSALLSFPFFPTLDGYQRGAILARTGIFKSHDIDARAWVDFLDEVGIESTVLYPTAGLPTWLAVATKLNPLTYAVQPMRHVVFSHLDISSAAAKALDPRITWMGWPVPVALQLVVLAALGAGVFAIAVRRFSQTD